MEAEMDVTEPEGGDEYETEIIETGKTVNADAPDDDQPEPTVEASEETEEAPAPPPVDPRYQELLERLEQTDRRSRALEEQLVAASIPQMQRVPETPPINPRDIKNMEQWEQYAQWQQAYNQQMALDIARSEARAESSIATIRGELNADAMGHGKDYDSVVGKYVKPMIARSPGLQAALAMMQDRAAAEYSLGMMMALAESSQGGRVKSFKKFWDFIEGKASESGQTAEKVAKAVKAQAQKVGHKVGSTPKKPTAEPTPEEIRAYTEEQYKAWRKRRGNPF